MRGGFAILQRLMHGTRAPAIGTLRRINTVSVVEWSSRSQSLAEGIAVVLTQHYPYVPTSLS